MLDHRYVFVGGLHRSGTSLVAQLIGDLPDVAAISDAPVPENEGVYLQGAIPHTARHGIPMHFATDPDQHHIEGSRHDRLEVRERIEADWAPHFGAGHWRVEKSPVNLTRMRLYQQLFPLSQFVVVMRHPEAVAAAVSKWVDAPPAALLDHWLEAHDIVAKDLPFLHSVLVVRYEDLVADPEATVARLAAFLQVPATGPAREIRDGNAAYAGRMRLDDVQATRAARWGYGPGMAVAPAEPCARHALRAVVDAVEAAGRQEAAAIAAQ
ncbi:sulfotransferase family protein [Amaricoccus macauensis]|uniref:sulfotransferase family protein n=1 Tax=Amaricoccus macauensis TaxID=57001 RepID=UPI003C7E3853